MELDPTSPSGEPKSPAMSSSRYEELKQLVAAMESDFVRFFDQGNKAAGTRVRGAMQQLKTLAQTIRTEVQNMKNTGQKPS
jgi:hypothetical protein